MRSTVRLRGNAVIFSFAELAPLSRKGGPIKRVGTS